MVNLDQFTAVVEVFSLNAEERLQCLLLTVRDVEECLVWGDAFVQVNAVKPVKIMRQLMLGTFLQQIRQIKIVAVKVDQVRKGGCKGKEVIKQSRFLNGILTKPLADLPGTLCIKGCADQIERGAFRSKAGGLNIQKQELFQGSDLLQRIAYGKRIQSLFYDLHGFLRFISLTRKPVLLRFLFFLCSYYLTIFFEIAVVFFVEK